MVEIHGLLKRLHANVELVPDPDVFEALVVLHEYAFVAPCSTRHLWIFEVLECQARFVILVVLKSLLKLLWRQTALAHDGPLGGLTHPGKKHPR